MNIRISKLLNTTSINKKRFFNFSSQNFSRTNNIMTPVYPGDFVVVLPPWGFSKLNNYAKRKLGDRKDLQPQYGYVKKMLRKKGLTVVSGINRQKVYQSPYSEYFFEKLEKGEHDKIKVKRKSMPIAVDRIRLVDENKKIISARFIIDESGKRIRINAKTGEELIPKKTHETYKERIRTRKDGEKDTTDEFRLIRTYNNENFEKIMLKFIKKIKKKEEIESNLILRDI